MKPEIIAIISALGGILLGTIGNVLIAWISKKTEYQREIKKLVMEISLAEWKEASKFAVDHLRGIVKIFPVMSYVIANSNLIKLVGKQEIISETAVKELLVHNLKIRKLIEDYSQEVHSDDSRDPEKESSE